MYNWAWRLISRRQLKVSRAAGEDLEKVLPMGTEITDLTPLTTSSLRTGQVMGARRKITMTMQGSSPGNRHFLGPWRRINISNHLSSKCPSDCVLRDFMSLQGWQCFYCAKWGPRNWTSS